MTVYDIDGGDDYIESLAVTNVAYDRSPLRPSSGDSVTSRVLTSTDPSGRRVYTSTPGDVPNPVEPTELTNDQAERGVRSEPYGTAGGCV